MNHLLIKEDALIGARHFDDVMIPIWIAILELSPMMVGGEVVVTCGSDAHTTGLHPVYRALDVRISNVLAENNLGRNIEAHNWASRLERRLGRHYDVVVEDDHIHIEYDLKGV